MEEEIGYFQPSAVQPLSQDARPHRNILSDYLRPYVPAVAKDSQVDALDIQNSNQLHHTLVGEQRPGEISACQLQSPDNLLS